MTEASSKSRSAAQRRDNQTAIARPITVLGFDLIPSADWTPEELRALKVQLNEVRGFVAFGSKAEDSLLEIEDATEELLALLD